MGVPALFRWLHRKYPKIVQPVQENNTVPISGSNPNGLEFHNLYLDMNGIIHPCCHPQTGPAPASEEEMHLAIFAYLDRIMRMIRPRKLLYLAVDGVAPRAKMNQQRSRRFRAAQEAAIKRQQLEEENAEEDDEEESTVSSVFDSNVITPGTKFMGNISKAIRYWAASRLSSSDWSDLSIIISDSSVPGEGEHKIVDYIRRLRTTPDHDANECHVIYGLDADLIMLSMATHEPRFKVLREDVFWEEQQQKKDQNSNQPEEKKIDSSNQVIEKPFIFLDVTVLREYLDVEMRTSIPDSNSLEPERSLDDWIMLCFLVGNDFLPHLPSLDIRENAIDTLIGIYRRNMRNIGGHLTRNGAIAFDRLCVVMNELSQAEDGILARRMERDQRWRESQAIRDAARELEEESNNPRKRKHKDVEDEEEDIIDQIKLGQPGYRARYYEHKFGIVDMESTEGKGKIKHICDSYLEGLSWVLLYYYQGCPSWKWFYPYHYAPFAKDLAERLRDGDFNLSKFDPGEPFRPFDQLMSVFPAASNEHLPEVFRNLMTVSTSPISHFYPLDFKIDLNGKRYPWQGVALLPFIDETLLLSTLAPVYNQLDEESRILNRQGQDELWIGASNSLFGFMQCLDAEDDWQPIDPVLSRGISGSLKYLSLEIVPSTVSTMKDLNSEGEQFIAGMYKVPACQSIFRSQILHGYKPDPPVLTDADRAMVASGRNKFRSHGYNGGGGGGSNTMYREQFERDQNREMRGHKDERPTGSSSSIFTQPTPPLSSTSSYSYRSASSAYSTFANFTERRREDEEPMENRPRNTSRFGSSSDHRGSQSVRRSMVMQMDKETLSKLVKQFQSSTELSEVLKSYLQERAGSCIKQTGSFVIGLSGGSLIPLLAPHILSLITPEWFCFLVDERFVPESSKESNAGQWLAAGLPSANLHRRTQRDATSSPVALEAAAVAAEDALKWVLEETGKDGADLILLGMGADGHTASLFPSSHHFIDRSLQYSRLYVAVSDAPAGFPQRLSMTLAGINSAKEAIFVVTSAVKAESLRKVLVLHDKKLPAYHVKPERLTWYVDNAAATRLLDPIAPEENVNSSPIHSLLNSSSK